MRQAKPTEADQEAVLRFMQELEEAVEHGGGTVKIAAIVLNHWPRVGPSWQRVYWAGLSCIQNACDPDLSYLEFKPEIREAMEKQTEEA